MKKRVFPYLPPVGFSGSCEMESDQRGLFGGGGVPGSQRVGGKEGVVALNGPHVGNHRVVDHSVFVIPMKG